jgi:peptidoglycan hydrolase-like protein with peptidoglycan-binding domain
MGSVAGINTDVDLDLFYGSREDLLGLGVPIPWPGYVMSQDNPANVAEDVKRVQKRLSVEQTGVYGPTTAESVRAFQEAAGIGQTAQVGEQTWNALFN